MARLSATLTLAAGLLLGWWIGTALAQTPDRILGTTAGDDATYTLFEPATVVAAGGGGLGLLSNAPPKPDGTGAVGTGRFASREDHVHPAGTAELPSLTGNASKHLAVNTGATAVEWVDPPAGPRAYGTSARPLAVSQSGGSSATVSRSDHVHPSEVLPLGAANSCYKVNAAGNGVVWAACTIPLPSDADPITEGAVTPGTSTKWSRGDHVHPAAGRRGQSFTGLTDTPSGYAGAGGRVVRVKSDRSGLEFANVTPTLPALTGNKGKFLSVNTGETGTLWADVPSGGAALSDSTPQPPGPPVPGAGSKASRDDHVHAPPLLSEVTPKAAAGGGNPGRNVIASRDDHVHPSQIPSLSGNAKSVLSVKSDASATEWIHPTTVILEGAGIAAADKGKLLAANSAGNGIALQTTHDAVLAGLPALTGQGGECLKANAAATGLEFASCSDAGNVVWQDFATGSFSYAGYRGALVQSLSTAIRNNIIAAHNRADFLALAVRVTGNGNYSTGFLWPKGVDNIGTTANFQGAFHFYYFDTTDSTVYDGQTEVELILGATASSIVFTDPQTLPSYALKYAISGLQVAAGGSSGGPAIPEPTAAGKLQHLRVNAAGAAYELATAPPDLSDEVEDNEGAIEHLDAVTSDLIAGDPPAGWTDSPNAATAGIWLAGSIPSLAEARAGTYSPSISSGTFDTKVVVVRLPSTTSAARARVAIAGVGAGGAGVNELVTGYRLLGASSDGSFKYYRDSLALGSAVTAVKMQTTTAAHVGTSQYEGLPTRVKAWAIKGSGLPVPVESLPFGTPWSKLFEGNFSGTGQINIQLPNDAGAAIIAAQRDTEGAGVYRQFMVQFAWNIGTGSGEELVQTQALLPGVPLDGSVGQATQGLRYYGVLPGLDAVCPIFLKASTTAAALLGNGSCQPDWGNRGNAHPTVFWKLWGRR